MRRSDLDWYSPTRILSSPVKYDFPGDRFIPNRSLMDLDHAQSLLTSKTGEKSNQNKPNSQFNDEYRKKVEDNLKLDSEGRPFRMLVFRGMPASSRKPIRHIDEILRLDGPEAWKKPKKIRSLPKSPDRILDAPGLKDNYYLNLLDWGKSNILAIALGSDVYLWNAETKNVDKMMQTVSENDYPSSVAWSENSETVAIGLESSTIQLWDAETSRPMRTLEGHRKRVGCLAWNGQSLASGSLDKSIINHDIRAKNSLTSHLRAHTDEVCGLKWSGRGNLLASGGNDNVIHIWESSIMGSFKSLQRLKDHCAAVKALAWCPYQFHILASGGGSADRCIKLWNSQTGKCIKSIDTKSQVCGLEWNVHHKEILSGHGFSQYHLSLWRYPSMSKVGDLMGHTARIISLTQSPDGLTVASAGADETLRFWKVFEPPKITMTDMDCILSLKRFQIR